MCVMHVCANKLQWWSSDVSQRGPAWSRLLPSGPPARSNAAWATKHLARTCCLRLGYSHFASGRQCRIKSLNGSYVKIRIKQLTSCCILLQRFWGKNTNIYPQIQTQHFEKKVEMYTVLCYNFVFHMHITMTFTFCQSFPEKYMIACMHVGVVFLHVFTLISKIYGYNFILYHANSRCKFFSQNTVA